MNPKHKKQHFSCSNCNKEIFRWESQVKIWKTDIQFNELFCSKKCKAKWQKNNLKGEKNPNWKGGLEVKTCVLCKNKFTTKRHKSTAKFCSVECYANFKSKTMKGRGIMPLSQTERYNLEKIGMAIESRSRNSIKFGTDNLKHMMAKTLVGWIISSRNRTFYTEVVLKRGIADVIDFDEKMIYEVENNYNEKRIKEKMKLLEGNDLKDIIVFDISKYKNTEEDKIKMFEEFDAKIP